MCGLTGLVPLQPVHDPAECEAIVRRMNQRIAHRGPDDAGVEWRDRVCLGSLRLSIIDLSAAGHMPMRDASGRWAIVYNGEVYNFEALRAELAAQGHEFRSRTDTEVVLHAFMAWGLESMHRFVGMFAFAIHDRDTDTVTLVRDRFGIKPLYYARTGRFLLFASEMKALLPELEQPRIDKWSLLEWALYRNVDVLTPETLIEGVRAVLPGQAVAIRAGEITLHQWYAPLRHVDRDAYARYEAADSEAVVDEIDRTLDDATRLRLVSDVPVGTLLSGGLDSSLITTIAARHSRDLTAFHVSVAGHPDLDERRFAEQLTGKLEIPFVPFELNGENFRRALPLVSYFSDLPLTHANSIAYYLISKVARDHGVIVLLSGEGADELFGGYGWNYRRKAMFLRLQPWLERIPDKIYDVLALLVYARAGMPVGVRRFREVLPATVDLVDRYARLDWTARCEEAYGFVDDPRQRAVLGSMLADLSDFLSPLLRRLDRTSMAASVECRVPFLDHRLVHKVVNLPLGYRLHRRTDKWILKQLARRYFGGELVTRKKMGFPLPLADYLAPLANLELFAGGFCEQTLGLSRRGLERLISSWRGQVHGFFGLVALEVWGRQFFMGQSVGDVDELLRRLEPRQGPVRASPARAEIGPSRAARSQTCV